MLGSGDRPEINCTLLALVDYRKANPVGGSLPMDEEAVRLITWMQAGANWTYFL